MGEPNNIMMGGRHAARAALAPFHSDIGRPPVDPELMIRMLIIGYCFGIRSERRLCKDKNLRCP